MELPPLVILNPAADRGHVVRLRAAIKGRLLQCGGDYCETASAGQATELARAATLANRPIVAIGGDGTIHEVVNGIMESERRVPLGIVAAGSGNDYAWRTLGLPRDPLAALTVALEGVPAPVDLGQVNTRYFVNSFGVGIDANIAAGVERLKRVPFLDGSLLYWTSTLRELCLHYGRQPVLRLQRGAAPLDAPRRYILVAATIGSTYGGGFIINPHADPQDGLLDVCMVGTMPWRKAMRALPRLQVGQHGIYPEVRFERLAHVVITSSTPVHAHMDGEIITGVRFALRIIPGGLVIRR
jgi:diacylglycerol kinase (ATP)